MNPLKATNRSVIGKLIRFPLQLIPKSAQVRILTGKLRGKKWIVGSGVHGYWLGFYEAEEQAFFNKFLKEGDIVYDIGANVGFYSLLSASFVGSQGHVYAFEPLPRNLSYLRTHIDINKVKNITVLPLAIMDQPGSVRFSAQLNSAAGKVSADGFLEVKAESLDHLFKGNTLKAPTFIKMDIEGAEYEALLGAKELIASTKPAIFLSVHNGTRPGVRDLCKTVLTQYGYTMDPMGGKSFEKASDFFCTFQSSTR